MAISFNGNLKRIYITNVSTIMVNTIYSAWKNWLLLDNNLQFLQAFRVVGGDPTVSGQSSPVYYFLTNGWRIVIDGIDVIFSYNIYTDEGDNPVVALNGATASLNNSDVGIVSSNAGDVITYQNIFNALTVINDGIKKASKFIPHNANI
jgi:hypothetical protein